MFSIMTLKNCDHWCLKSINSAFPSKSFGHQGLTTKKECLTFFRILRVRNWRVSLSEFQTYFSPTPFDLNWIRIVTSHWNCSVLLWKYKRNLKWFSWTFFFFITPAQTVFPSKLVLASFFENHTKNGILKLKFQHMFLM